MNGSSVCWTTRVGTRIVGSTARTSNSVTRGIMRVTVAGLAARRSMPCPRCPDLLVPRHVRIDHMLDLARAPHRDHGSERIPLKSSPSVRCSNRIRVALEHDQRGRARRMCRREQRRWRERAVDREEDRFATSEIVEHRGDAVGPLLQGRQRARRDGIGGSGARLVEEDQPTERCHRLDPPLYGRQLRKDLTVREPVRDEHEVASASA